MYTIGDVIFGSGGEYAGFYHPTITRASYLANPDLFTASGFQSVQERNMYYSGGFLPAGAGQMPSIGGSGGGILGAVTSGLQTFLPTLFQQRPGGGFGQPPAPVPPTQTVPATHPVIGAAGNSGSPTGVMMGGGGGHRARYGSPGQKGYHMIRKGPHAGMWTRNRHRNVANIRALRRALSRAHGFERICRKVMHFVHPGRRGRAVFKRRRRRS